ncbi:ankyrin repeat-containing domain protein [Xylariales sp. PMI_506]|nr:ankyrin repeat-containing domain protein [Xylariales sp. PMI_506]
MWSPVRPAQQRPRATKLRDEEWEAWRPLIVTKRSEVERLDDLVKVLRAHGLKVSKSQLESRLEHWGFRHNLTPSLWRHVKRVIEERAKAGKKSAVFASWYRFTQQKVDREINRHRLVMWQPPLDGDVVDEEFPLFFSVQSTIKAKNQIAAPDAIAAFTTKLARQGSKATLSKADKAAILPFVFNQLARKSLQVVFASGCVTSELAKVKSIDYIAGRFDVFIPETYPNENIHRAVILNKGSSSQLQAEALKLIIYLISNNLLFEKGAYNDFLDSCMFTVALCRLCGLTEQRILRRLITLSRSNPTLATVTEVLFKAAVHADAPDVVHLVLHEDSRISPDMQVRLPRVQVYPSSFRNEMIRALYVTVVNGSIDLINVLLDAKASIWPSDQLSLSLVSFTILEAPSHLAKRIVQLLLDKGATINDVGRDGLISPLQSAIVRGDTDLIEFAFEAGADLQYQAGDQCVISTILDAGYQADTLALTAVMYYADELPIDLLKRCIGSCDDLNVVSECNMIDIEPPLVAALYYGGSIEVVKTLLEHGADINRTYLFPWKSSATTALIEATHKGDIVLVDLLLHRGADANKPAWSPAHPFEQTPLQVAASHGYIGIVRSLLNHGANVNAKRGLGEMTALEHAAYEGRLDTVQLLLEHGACIEGTGRFQYLRAIKAALSAGHHAVAAILKSYKQWTNEDQELWDGLTSVDWGQGDCPVIFSNEHSTREMAELLLTTEAILLGENDRLYEYRNDGGLCVIWYGLLSAVERQLMSTTKGWRDRISVGQRNEMIRVYRWYSDFDSSTGNFNGDSLDYGDRLPLVGISELDGLADDSCEGSENENPSQAKDPSNVIEQPPTESKENSLLGEETEEQLRERCIRRDMAGLEEAPFFPVEWAW